MWSSDITFKLFPSLPSSWRVKCAVTTLETNNTCTKQGKLVWYKTHTEMQRAQTTSSASALFNSEHMHKKHPKELVVCAQLSSCLATRKFGQGEGGFIIFQCMCTSTVCFRLLEFWFWHPWILGLMFCTNRSVCTVHFRAYAYRIKRILIRLAPLRHIARIHNSTLHLVQ